MSLINTTVLLVGPGPEGLEPGKMLPLSGSARAGGIRRQSTVFVTVTATQGVGARLRCTDTCSLDFTK